MCFMTIPYLGYSENATASYFSGGKLWLVAFPLRSGIIPAKPYPDVSYALLYQATG